MVSVQKWPFLELFFFAGNIGQKNILYDILERENGFQGYKNKQSKKSNNWPFSKGVKPWFWSKNGHFSTFFFFGQYRPRKCLLRYSRAKKRLSRLYKHEVQKVGKTEIFSKGLTHGFYPKRDIFRILVFLAN